MVVVKRGAQRVPQGGGGGSEQRRQFRYTFTPADPAAGRRLQLAEESGQWTSIVASTSVAGPNFYQQPESLGQSEFAPGESPGKCELARGVQPIQSKSEWKSRVV